MIKVLAYDRYHQTLVVSLHGKKHYLKKWRSSSRVVFKVDNYVIKVQEYDPSGQDAAWTQNYKEVIRLRTLGKWSKYIPKTISWGGMRVNIKNVYNYIIQEYVDINTGVVPNMEHMDIIHGFSKSFKLCDLRTRGPCKSSYYHNWGLTNSGELYILDYAV